MPGHESVFVVSVLTDNYAYENEWTLKKQSEDQQWIDVESYDFELNNHQHVNTYCLESDLTYKWNLTDSYGDGLCDYGGYCGSFSITLNDEEILLDEIFSYEVSTVFTTPNFLSLPPTTESCSNVEESWVEQDGQTRSCNDIAIMKRKRGRKCNTGLYQEKCPGLCTDQCACHDYESDFKANNGGWVNCDNVRRGKCRIKRVKLNCPALCNSECS